MRAEDGISDRNERTLAEKESLWASSLQKIRKLVLDRRDDHIEEGDVLLALEYYLYAGIRDSRTSQMGHARRRAHTTGSDPQSDRR